MVEGFLFEGEKCLTQEVREAGWAIGLADDVVDDLPQPLLPIAQAV
jgi:hypothetical protein